MAKVFLSAGHGGSDPGAVANGLREKDGNLQTMLACKRELERHGVSVVCSRLGDEEDPVQDEVREANASGADLAVSFHENAGGGHGFEGFYYTSDANGKRLVEIATRKVAELGQESHGNPLKSGNHLMFVNSTNMTAVLFESFFVDSDDRLIGDTVAEQQAFGVAYAKAILEYLGIPYKNQGSSGSSGGQKPSGKNMYRVRKSWGDAKSQIGAFSDLANAKRACKPGYTVYDSNGRAVYSNGGGASQSAYTVKVTTDALNIRAGAGTNYNVVGCIRDYGVYTITETKNGWGKLKSGAGWISLDYTQRV